MNSTPLAGSNGNENPRDWMVGHALARPDLQSSRLLFSRVAYDNARQMEPDVTVMPFTRTEVPACPEIDQLLEFIHASSRGVVK